jgi:hypothetical protein
MPIEVHPLPFRFVNYIRVKEWPEPANMMDVGRLTDLQAREYWDELYPLWIDHVQKRRAHLPTSSVDGEVNL